MKPKVLIIGIKGMAGHLLYEYFKERNIYELYGIARNIKETEYIFNLDVSNTDDLVQIINDEDFDCIINCIGILNKDAEDHPAKAIWFNSYFPHFLEEITVKKKTRIIHISTDCVFSGKEGGYTEYDFKNGIGYYAQSKALGELDNTKDVTLRTSIIGPELNTNGIGLFNWFMNQSVDTKLKGFSKAYWSGITTLELAKVIEQLILQNISGLIQIPAPVKIDKYNLLRLFNTVFRNGKMTIENNSDYCVDKSLESLRTDFTYSIPDYLTMLEEQKKWMLEHPEIYRNYSL